jgi:hypothetical protein
VHILNFSLQKHVPPPFFADSGAAHCLMKDEGSVFPVFATNRSRDADEQVAGTTLIFAFNMRF